MQQQPTYGSKSSRSEKQHFRVQFRRNNAVFLIHQHTHTYAAQRPTSIIMAIDESSSSASITAEELVAQQQKKAEMLADEDPLLISQSLTYVTDDGGTLHSFQSAPFSTGESPFLYEERLCALGCFYIL